MLDDHDLLFTDMVVQSDLNFFRRARRWYDNDIRRDADGTATEVRFRPMAYTASMTSYLVNRRSIGRISDMFGRELAGGARSTFSFATRWVKVNYGHAACFPSSHRYAPAHPRA
jgi:hypothetical protein